jgi:hypothetical protein
MAVLAHGYVPANRGLHLEMVMTKEQLKKLLSDLYGVAEDMHSRLSNMTSVAETQRFHGPILAAYQALQLPDEPSVAVMKGPEGPHCPTCECWPAEPFAGLPPDPTQHVVLEAGSVHRPSDEPREEHADGCPCSTCLMKPMPNTGVR